MKQFIENILSSGSIGMERPLINKNNESNIPGIYLVGDLAGAPVIKYAMKQGHDVVESIAKLKDAKSDNPEVLDILIAGAGASGLNAALTAKELGLNALILEKEKIANTIENFPDGKWVYAEPDDNPAVGKLWLDGANKELLLEKWHELINTHDIDIHTNEALISINKNKDYFEVRSSKGEYKAKRIILATGQRGNPRKLNVEGENNNKVLHSLHNPKKCKNKTIIVVGGGNSAVEAAVALSENNLVYLSYRKKEFSRIFKDNERQLSEKVSEGKIKLLLQSEVKAFSDNETILEYENQELRLNYDYAFVLIGADLPRPFLKSIGIQLENEWKGAILKTLLLTCSSLFGLFIMGQVGTMFWGNIHASDFPYISGVITFLVSIILLIFFGLKRERYSWLGLSFLVCYTVYAAKIGENVELWPYTGWGYKLLSFAERPWSFWYTVLYTLLVTVFGILALKRWGIDKRDSFQIWRYVSLIAFQWTFFFIIPEFLFQWALEFENLKYLANDPQFSGQPWRAYGIVYAWPLFFYSFFFDPHQIWVVWGVFLTFVIVPVFTIWNGKRYCSWICGCGGLAETLGDRWRHLAPKGPLSIKWEWMNSVILIIAVLVTSAILIRNIGVSIFYADESLDLYKLLIDVWLVGIIPVTLYPFLGGKVWCRYWCPLAKFMHLTSKISVKLGFGKFGISANSKCIACKECSRNCQVGIPVMEFALKQEILDNTNSSCIGCGICVTACPMNTLSFGRKEIK